MKPFASLFILLSCLAVAQQSQPSRPSMQYREYRQEITKPPFRLAEAERAIKKTKIGDDDFQGVSDQVFKAMPFEEKFTYTMIHGDNFAQNCDVMPIFEQEEHKIFAFPMGPLDQQTWSERQLKFLKNNRTRIVALIGETIQKRHRVGMNLKGAIIELKAKELIPVLITEFKRDRKDNDILSTLQVLMKDGKYGPFLASQSYAKLYGPNSDYRSS
jgi:hypothetical protein